MRLFDRISDSSVLGALEHFGLSVHEFSMNVSRLPGYFRDLKQYERLSSASAIPVEKLYPMLTDVDQEAGVTSGHYFHQDLWAARKVYRRGPRSHFDVGSSIGGFIAHLLVFMEVTVIDIRPIGSNVDGVQFIRSDATELSPIKDDSIGSMSSLHTAEHFGLGRYGDPIDPDAHLKFMTNLQRVLRPGGVLYFSVPVGRERVEFNAHRVFSPTSILDAFDDLELVSLDGVIDGRFVEGPELKELEDNDFACGLFEFRNA